MFQRKEQNKDEQNKDEFVSFKSYARQHHGKLQSNASYLCVTDPKNGLIVKQDLIL